MTFDPIKLAQVIAALISCVFTAWALRRALKAQSYANRGDEPELIELRPTAARKVRQQAFLLVIQAILVVTGILSMVTRLTHLQVMAVRGMALVIVSLLLMLLSAFNHWDQRTIDRQPWDGKERRKV